MRKRRDEISARAYNNVIGIVLLWGFLLNMLMCRFCTDMFMKWDIRVILIGYFLVALLGIFMSKCSDNAFISFVGYNFVVLPVGVLLSLALAEYDNVSIMNTIRITATITVLMMFIGMLFPEFFKSMGKCLLFTLTAVVISEMFFILFGITNSTWWDLGVALLFSLYIAYDWVKAQEKTKTLDNAVDSVVELYLDIVNLFIRILAASGKKSSSSKK